ncbi:bifunctional diaminohydroxyphosphoribosylaminopyrimidine deaminase/5-amino-6-(5-phosphoribosylamino)uracil reductase RibD [Tepidibacter hydrothermalis]|uniref:Riboflavin biosynthesis protein RibD n=1 Tax=Tepidibacter hydrothermalis TaxID=3036126 RepID=A0ABY8EDE3_9FIRM|nr:bifunctional diaminohydroxyphosphoribosylaminopyrimidine deaminase/5-amino-6-(5-phosphoribosylamino)uracil reductase RibD [Tepidibacter hydrothermalis]WFD10959.1 bifunctional diaminohydroxyphosphoribosylaminopyrimidine deaminase/5-amino-6-(5-phosphoribosylamino)uracil reductase RibD [Tepidibacter hydrothermalis]
MDKYMKRAIELAIKGKGFTSPNPLVGAVIVKEDRIIGEGYHEYYGGPHAEVNAITNACEEVTGSTMYVTLEPCSHFGKTPPCAQLIIDKKIRKVIIGMKDPNPIVAGNGIKLLRDHGIEVIVGVLEEEIKKMNEIFIKYISTKLPFCILKTAMTLDGKIATSIGDSKWITNEKSREYVHEIRHQVSGIMVGIGTVLQDDPSLTTRLKDKESVDPVRIIVDTKCRIPLDSKVLNLNSNSRTIIVTTEKADRNKLELIKEKKAEIIITPLKNDQVDLEYLIQKLGEMEIDSILIEGGSTLNYSILKVGCVDKVISFIAPKIIGGENSKTPVGGAGIAYIKDSIELERIEVKMIEQDIMIEGYLGKEE